MSSIQFSHLNNSYYTNALFTYRPFSASGKAPETPSNKTITSFDRDILSIYTVRSHVNRTNEILLQDSLNDLNLISADGKILWKLPISDRIVSDVNQIDFFNNGKLQYLFSTANAIHIIDRLGNYVNPYPVHLSSVEIEFLSLIDYDNSKKYRILLADKKGKLWMYDKEGKLLDGWQPKDTGGELAMPPRHYRIKGRDYILAVRKDGQVYLVNRRGEDLRKFPLNSESVPSGDCYLEIGTTAANTYFVIISRDGFRIKFNVEGKIQSREALLKTSVTSVFSLVRERANKSYLILQQDGRQLSLTDETGRKIITANLSGIKPSDVRFFDFGGSKMFIVITDKAQGFSYVYDGDGNLLTTPPLESTLVEIRVNNSDQPHVFFVQGRSLIMQPL
jgi:WD40 repeat protein